MKPQSATALILLGKLDDEDDENVTAMSCRQGVRNSIVDGMRDVGVANDCRMI